MPEIEKITELMEKIEQLNALLIPILFCVIALTFMVAMRFISWMMDEHNKEEESKYLRLKNKFDNKD